MKKTALIVISLGVLAMGVLALIPSITLGSEPVWHSVVKIVVGAAGLYIGFKKD